MDENRNCISYGKWSDPTQWGVQSSTLDQNTLNWSVVFSVCPTWVQSASLFLTRIPGLQIKNIYSNWETSNMGVFRGFSSSTPPNINPFLLERRKIALKYAQNQWKPPNPKAPKTIFWLRPCLATYSKLASLRIQPTPTPLYESVSIAKALKCFITSRGVFQKQWRQGFKLPLCKLPSTVIWIDFILPLPTPGSLDWFNFIHALL